MEFNSNFTNICNDYISLVTRYIVTSSASTVNFTDNRKKYDFLIFLALDDSKYVDSIIIPSYTFTPDTSCTIRLNWKDASDKSITCISWSDTSIGVYGTTGTILYVLGYKITI